MADFDIDAFAQRFVEQYNTPGSDVRRFYSKDLVWRELPLGRTGGQQDLFDAFAGVREAVRDTEIPSIIRTFSQGSMAVLENTWRGVRTEDGQPIQAILAWVWVFDEDGLIVRQHDYFMPVNDEPLGYE